MGVAGLYLAVSKGQPLAEFNLRFKVGCDVQEAVQLLNSLSDEFETDSGGNYGDPSWSKALATKAGAMAVLGLELRRIPVGEVAGQTKYAWNEVNPKREIPEPASRFVESVGLSQPGSNDNGAWCE